MALERRSRNWSRSFYTLKSRSVDMLTGRIPRPPSSTRPAFPPRATTSYRVAAGFHWAAQSPLTLASYEPETLAKVDTSPPIHEHQGALNSPQSSSESVQVRCLNCQQSKPKSILKKASLNIVRAEPLQPDFRPKYSLSYNMTDPEILRLAKEVKRLNDLIDDKDVDIKTLETINKSYIATHDELKRKVDEHEKGGAKLAEESEAVKEKERLEDSNEYYLQEITRMKDELAKHEVENIRHIQQISQLGEKHEKHKDEISKHVQNICRLSAVLEKQEGEKMELIKNQDLSREKQELKTRRLEKVIAGLEREKDALESEKSFFFAKCRAMGQQVLDVNTELKLIGENNELLEGNNKRLRELLDKSEENVKKLEWYGQWADRIAKQVEWKSSNGRLVSMEDRIDNRYSMPA